MQLASTHRDEVETPLITDLNTGSGFNSLQKQLSGFTAELNNVINFARVCYNPRDRQRGGGRSNDRGAVTNASPGPLAAPAGRSARPTLPDGIGASPLLPSPPQSASPPPGRGDGTGRAAASGRDERVTAPARGRSSNTFRVRADMESTGDGRQGDRKERGSYAKSQNMERKEK